MLRQLQSRGFIFFAPDRLVATSSRREYSGPPPRAVSAWRVSVAREAMISRGVFEELDWTSMIKSVMDKEDQPTNEESYYYSPVELDRLRAFSCLTRLIQNSRKELEAGERLAAF